MRNMHGVKAMAHSNEIAQSKIQDHNPDAGKILINRIFKELQATFPAWASALRTEEEIELAKKIWTKSLIENKVTTMEQIRRGFRQARSLGSKYLPSVGEFIIWCRPDFESLGLPDSEKAYRNACKMAHSVYEKGWLHPVVYVAAKEIGFFELKTKPERDTARIFKNCYVSVCERVIAGEDFSGAIPKALPKPKYIPVSKEKAKANIQKLKQLVGSKRA